MTLKAKQAMEEWEKSVPPANEVQDLIITGVDEATKLATLQDDERQVPVPDEMLEELKALLQQVAELPEEEKETKKIQSKIEVVPDDVAIQLGLAAEPALVLQSFVLTGGAAADDAAVEPADAAPVEEAADN